MAINLFWFLFGIGSIFEGLECRVVNATQRGRKEAEEEEDAEAEGMPKFETETERNIKHIRIKDQNAKTEGEEAT